MFTTEFSSLQLHIALLKNFKSSGIDTAHQVFLIRFFVLSILTIWVTGFLLPLASTIDNQLANFLITKIYSTVCHQESTKCISIDNNSMLVCARCAGIYSGALIAAISCLFILRPIAIKNLLLISVIPMLADVLLVSLGIYTYSRFVSFTTGMIFGSIVYLFILSEIEKLILKQIFCSGNE